MKRYEAYKDSGVDWIGEIPEGWEVIKMKYLFKDTSIKNQPNLELLSVTQDQGVVPRDLVENRMVMPTGNLESFKVIEKGDFAISLRSFEGGLEYSKYKGIVSPAYTVLKSQKEIHDNYYKYLFKSISFIGEMQLSVVGIREGKNISYEELRYSFLQIPPLSEQTAIAQFLDDKTAKIDQTIAIRQKEIELLKERRQILIQKAVTKGLDDTVKLKDSGVDWIGEIPEHWEVTPGRTIFKERKESNKGLKNSIVLSLSYGKIIIKPEEKMYGLVPESFETYQLVYEGDIIVRGTDLQNDKTSLRTGLSHYNGIITSAYLNLIVKNSSAPSFIQLFLYVMDISKEIYKYGSGLRQNLSFNDFKLMPILDVPLDEQIQIVSYLEEIEEKIAKAILLKQQEIEKLKEYKTVLIDNVVTGKVKINYL